MLKENNHGGLPSLDPFYPDGYVSTDQDRQQIIAQKERYAAKVKSINYKFPLRSFRRGFFEGNTDTISAVRENIKTLLLTLKGERINDANLGTNIPVLQGQLFEPITREETFENIRLEIESAIARYLPYIRVTNIRMITQEEEPILGNNKIRVNMTYVITDQQAMVDNINLTLTNPES